MKLAEIGQKVTTNLEAGKCKDKKNKNDELYFFKTSYKRMTWMPSKSKTRTIKKVSVKEQCRKHYELSMYYARVMMKLIQNFLC